MLNRARLDEIRAEVGDEDFAVVLEMFFEEIEEALDALTPEMDKSALAERLHRADFFLLAAVGEENLFGISIDLHDAAVREFLRSIEGQQDVAVGLHPAIACRVIHSPLHLAVFADNHGSVRFSDTEERMLNLSSQSQAREKAE